QRGNLEDALRNYDTAIRLKPDSAELYVQRARALEAKGAHDKALADCDKAIALDGKSILAHMMRAQVLIAKREFGRAKDDLETVLKLGAGYPFGGGKSGWEPRPGPHPHYWG